MLKDIQELAKTAFKDADAVSYTHLDVYKRQEWDRSGASKASVIISLEEVDGINDKLKEIIYQTQK